MKTASIAQNVEIGKKITVISRFYYLPVCYFLLA